MMRHTTTRRSFILGMAGAALGAGPVALAQNAAYPARPIRIVVPSDPGSLGDVFARYLAQQLTAGLGHAVVIENRPGGNQIMGTDAVAKSSPDGYSLLVTNQSAMVFNPILRKNLSYDPLKDFTPIAMLFETPTFLVISKDLPARSVPELIAHAKINPGKLSYASLGPGSSHHLLMERLKKQAGLDILHVPYKGSVNALNDLSTGRVNMMFGGGTLSLARARTGDIVALASTGERRSEITPDLPTMKETLPDFSANVWFGLVGPADIPASVTATLNTAVNKILKDPATHDKFIGQAMEPVVGSAPEAVTRRIAAEIPQWRAVAEAAGIQPE